MTHSNDSTNIIPKQLIKKNVKNFCCVVCYSSHLGGEEFSIHILTLNNEIFTYCLNITDYNYHLKFICKFKQNINIIQFQHYSKILINSLNYSDFGFYLDDNGQIYKMDANNCNNLIKMNNFSKFKIKKILLPGQYNKKTIIFY